MSTLTSPRSDRETPQQFVRSVSEIVRDLVTPRAALYWTDLLVSVALGQASFVVFLESASWAVKVPAFLIAGFALFRASLFLHEIQHFKPGTMRSFKFAWNVLVGIPFLTPSYTNDDHQGHHSNTRFGTDDDSEYAAFLKRPFATLAYYLSSIFWLPVFLVLRFMLLTPLAYVSPSLRRWIWLRASTQTWVNVEYKAELPDAADEPTWKLQEACCCVYCWVVIGLLTFGVLPWSWLANVYALSVFIITVNYLRGLSSHRFRSAGLPTTYLDQALDSTTIPGGLLTPLICPVGMRYHALHHVIPSLPYHNMRTAHYRLMQRLPADSAYHLTLRRSVWHSLGDLVRMIAEACRERRTSRDLHPAG